MADINISFVIPDAYVNRLRTAIDNLDPLQGGTTYPAQLKNIIRKWIKQYIQHSEIQGRDISVDDAILS